jgi:coenzyme PQQ precursor peptide PqqA
MLMNTEKIEIWETPDFVEISAAMECTAYTSVSAD